MAADERELMEDAERRLRIAMQNLNEAYNLLGLIEKEGARTRAVGGLATVLAAVMDGMCGQAIAMETAVAWKGNKWYKVRTGGDQ